MNNREINHAASLVPALLAKAKDMRESADQIDREKEGRSKVAVTLRDSASKLERQAHELKAAIDLKAWLGKRST